MTTIEEIKTLAREEYATLEAQSPRRIRRTVTSWYISASGQIRMATMSIQLCGEVYPEDWQAYAEYGAATAAECMADGRPWVVLQTMRVTVGSRSGVCCAVCDRGNIEE